MTAQVSPATTNAAYAVSLARATGGAMLFSMPLLMTMEMWQAGALMEPWRLSVYLLVSLPLLLGLSYFAGFEPTFCLRDEVLDALAAFAIGAVLSASMLLLFGVIGATTGVDEMVGMIAVCAVPAAIGALLAGKQLTERDIGEREKREAGYLGRLFVMLVGAVFLGFNLAPTEEMALISYQMQTWQSVLLLAGSIAIMHLLVFKLGFPGQARRRIGKPLKSFLIYTLPGYAIALAVSYYALWTFMLLDQNAPVEQAGMVVVLAFPAAIGAATARLVI